MSKFIILFLLITFSLPLTTITYSDADFCQQKEIWQILDKHDQLLKDNAFTKADNSNWLRLYKSYADYKADTLNVLNCLELSALNNNDFESVVKWLSLASQYHESHPDYAMREKTDTFVNHFADESDRLLLKVYREGINEDSLYTAISKLKSCNKYIEDLAKELADMIAVERDDSLAYELITKFNETFPYSKYNQAVFYFELAHHISKQNFDDAFTLIDSQSGKSVSHSYLSTTFLLSPTLRRNLNSETGQNVLLDKALSILDAIPEQSESIQILYDSYQPTHWKARLKLQKAKALYYKLLAEKGHYGDEESLTAILKVPPSIWMDIDKTLSTISFENNNTGEKAELTFWMGKLNALLSDTNSLEKAAKQFTECLVYGAPRKKYDNEAQMYLIAIHQKLNIKTDLPSWQRKLMNYDGVVFLDITESSGLSVNRETRVALGDYNNDSFADILLNGKRLYRNNGNLTFTEQTDTLGLRQLHSNGGLFADFNVDGMLDFMTISHGAEGNGERLMKNTGYSFVPVNERAGEIDDAFPTEGAAWVDCFKDAYPDLYLANYEKWRVQSGYEDRFFRNVKGYFTDETEKLGFLKPAYTFDPPQAGRGVAPADYDNDGIQEILVTNYRLCRNFLWDKQDTLFIDVAALSGVQGINKDGYFGHSIGADWGDFDNDGDLDVFIANLAHPRYIDISDVSMLLRNDGIKERIIDGETIRYRQFTDITIQAGITYDELHSDPLWFDADNDGYLDLFITSVYENDRSYLYRNNGNGTFTDITWLSGTRVYNGWGNACADFNHDGKLDFVVGSGNGTKVFLNQTKTTNKSLVLKPVWDNGKVSLISSYPAMINQPNSPAYGTRVIMKLKTPKGKQFSIIRELSSAKGTTSQNDQILHFGLGRNKLLSYEIYNPQLNKQ